MVSDVILSNPLWIWLALGALILAVEVGTGTGWLLWPAGSAAATGVIVWLLPMDFPLQVAVFAVLTIISALLGRRFLPKTEEGADINDNVGRLIGHKGQATGAFEDGRGRVLVDGKEWSAELAEGEALAPGADVEVTAVAADSRLRVRPI
jgi:inner membrane protein